MTKLKWTIRKLKWMTPEEEEILIDNILLYITGSFFALFILFLIAATFMAAYRGIT